MIKRSTLRRRLAWAALVVLLCSVVASLRLRHRAAASPTPILACAAADHDSVALTRFARDTIGRLRGRSEFVTRFTRRPDGVELRTEDTDPLAPHDGGLVAFDCEGRLTFLWLDGG